MSDSTVNLVDRLTKIGGRSHEALRAAFTPKTLAEVAAELQRKQQIALKEFQREIKNR